MNIEQHFNLSGHNIIIDNYGIQHFFVDFIRNVLCIETSLDNKSIRIESKWFKYISKRLEEINFNEYLSNKKKIIHELERDIIVSLLCNTNNDLHYLIRL